ncbi:B3 domain-containing transcription repressor VAL1 [Artemisia annua]|uniref:B3 domain-containing transcription repressor VAL1 n=1 Tax=Artemisia annua TaxID=35608 RepID=A0A2U1QGY9_ARTAN|nr:B3 domain-containing transcription repressor VAL1 [Artemisia annua]
MASSKNSCFNCNELTSDPLMNGWKFITGEHAQLCYYCHPNAVLIPLFAKLASASDANVRISRLIIPKDYAKAYFPAVSDYQKIPVNIVDTDGKQWDDIYFRCWPSRSSKTYVLTGLRAFIISKNMEKGDTALRWKDRHGSKKALYLDTNSSGFLKTIQTNSPFRVFSFPMAASSSIISCFGLNNSSSEQLSNGWKLHAGGFAKLCGTCYSLHKDGKFCEKFHLNEDGWRECEECAREPSHFNTESDPIDITDLVNPEPVLVLLFEKVLTANDARRKHSYFIIPNKHAKVRPNDPKEPDEKIILEIRKPYAEIPTDHQPFLFSQYRMILLKARKELARCLTDVRDRNLSPKWLNLLSMDGYIMLPEVKDGIYACLVLYMDIKGQGAIPLTRTYENFTPRKMEEKPLNWPISCMYQLKLEEIISTGERTKLRRDSSVKRFIRTRMGGGTVNPANSPNPVLTPLFEKVVTTTDSNLKTSRMIIPKKYALAHFPKVSGSEVVPLNIEDTEGQKCDVSLRCWRPHGNNTTYVITGLKDFYVSKNLQAGDIGTNLVFEISALYIHKRLHILIETSTKLNRYILRSKRYFVAVHVCCSLAGNWSHVSSLLITCIILSETQYLSTKVQRIMLYYTNKIQTSQKLPHFWQLAIMLSWTLCRNCGFWRSLMASSKNSFFNCNEFTSDPLMNGWKFITGEHAQLCYYCHPNAVLIPLFAKLASALDANLGISRLIIPKDYAKAYFPAVSDYQKIPVNIVDG